MAPWGHVLSMVPAGKRGWRRGGGEGSLQPPFPTLSLCLVTSGGRGPQSRADPLPSRRLQVAVSGSWAGQVVAPVSGNSLGVQRAEIKPGVREIQLCKDERGKMGVRLRAIDKVRRCAGA